VSWVQPLGQAGMLPVWLATTQPQLSCVVPGGLLVALLVAARIVLVLIGVSSRSGPRPVFPHHPGAFRWPRIPPLATSILSY